MSAAPEAKLLALWHRLSRLPLGKRLFNTALGRAVPYSGTVRPQVLELEPGRARILIRDRRRVRNHLRSVHAIALANLGELTSGLAMTAALPTGVRGIVTRIEVDYEKKARGAIIASSDVALPDPIDAPVDHVVSAELVDTSGDRVSTVRVHWRLAPRE